MKKPLSEKFGRRAIRVQQPIEQFYGIVQWVEQPLNNPSINSGQGINWPRKEIKDF